MSRRLEGLIVGLCLAALARPAECREERDLPGESLELSHYMRLLGDRPIAVVRIERRRLGAEAVGAEYPKAADGSAKILTVIDTTQRVVVSGHSKITRSRRELLTDPRTGAAVYMREDSLDNRAPRRMEITVAREDGRSKVLFITGMPGSTERREATVPGPAYFDLDGSVLAAAGALKPGGSMTAHVLSPEQAGVGRLTATVLGKRSRQTPGSGREEAFLVEVKNSDGRGTPWELLCGADGRMLQLEVGGLTTMLVPEEEAKLPLVAARVSNELATGPLGKSPLRTRKMTLLVKVPKDLGRGAIPEAPGQEVARDEREEGRYLVVLSERRPDGSLPRAALSEAERRAYTASTALIPAEHPLLREAAERAAGGETEPLIVAGRLVRYVSRRLANTARGASTASALEAFVNRSGDCTEHAALLVALARARGIPARRVSGLVHAGRSFIFHQWAEVYVDDRWVPCDPSKGLLGLPACYLRLGSGSPDDADYRSRALLLISGGRVEVIDVK